jgi:hypothetical protein
VRPIGERLKAHWLVQGINPSPGVSEGRLREFESRYGVAFPADMRGYQLHVDGTGSRSESDYDWFSFWPLGEIVRASDQYDEEQLVEDQSSYFVFADHSICLPAYAIRLTPSGGGPNPVIAITGHRGNYSTSVVARSFGEFIERYLANETSRSDLSIGLSLEA